LKHFFKNNVFQPATPEVLVPGLLKIFEQEVYADVGFIFWVWAIF